MSGWISHKMPCMLVNEHGKACGVARGEDQHESNRQT